MMAINCMRCPFCREPHPRVGTKVIACPKCEDELRDLKIKMEVGKKRSDELFLWDVEINKP